MEYNTQREHLPMPEYGRSVQEMVDHAVSIEDRAERQRCAETIVNIMWGMFPSLRDVKDIQVTLWDHLAYMSGYRLDVDYPFEVTRFDISKQVPEHIAYSSGEIRYRHYGRIIPELIRKSCEMPDGPERQMLVRLIAAQMKKNLLTWNKEMTDDNRIIEDLRFFSNGMLDIDAESISLNAGPQNGASARGQQRQFQRRKGRKRF